MGAQVLPGRYQLYELFTQPPGCLSWKIDRREKIKYLSSKKKSPAHSKAAFPTAEPRWLCPVCHEG